MPNSDPNLDATTLLSELRAFIDRAVAANGGDTRARNPHDRVKFHWPPHPVSYAFHVLATDWTGRTTFEAHGEVFEAEVAETPHGVFVRCPELWHEERGETLEEAVERIKVSCEPLFKRQFAINRTLERPGRFTGHIPELGPLGIMKLLYCDDRDVAANAHTQIEAHASEGVFFPSLLEILNDRRHPNRRTAQWCVLDLFEDLPRFARSPDEQRLATEAMRSLIWDAEDDYARTVYKAGVVLGGHLPDTFGGPTLLECLHAPSRIGRRSAMHGLYHVVEWIPEMREAVVSALREAARREPEPILREYANAMACDIEAEEAEHAPDPVFPDES